MKVESFDQLQIWKTSVKLAKAVYNLTSNLKFSKDFSLKDQIQRSIVSVSANIAEGFDRNNNKEFIRFLKIAKGSASETRSHLLIAKEIDYINIVEFEKVDKDLIIVTKQIGKLIEYLKKLQINNKTRKINNN